MVENKSLNIDRVKSNVKTIVSRSVCLHKTSNKLEDDVHSVEVQLSLLKPLFRKKKYKQQNSY